MPKYVPQHTDVYNLTHVIKPVFKVLVLACRPLVCCLGWCHLNKVEAEFAAFLYAVL